MCVGLAWRESIRPSASKSHAYLSRVPSGSAATAEKCTVSGLGPSVVSATAVTLGARLPPAPTKSTRASSAPGRFLPKNPSPYSSTYSDPSGPNSRSIGLS